ncbi:hypothetical protein [Halobaculum magnesiiphilum]|uniref:Uncharacterized protein n=1 Tax=Halobaculum magnesiiphilum TaxID=1017351 RepID=A0A8T8WEJ1_9EURY|nr:hypothetical protein [Halobaculum magnesiiphilum]QZP38251.1 hypothetical protein K6T50_03590 [Halobaculum magnesiiphilum]
MSIALTHFAFGALCMTLLLAYLPVRTRYFMAISVASGVWAMMPDFWRVSPIYENAFREIGHSAFGNVFWLHPLFDQADPSDSYRLAAVMVGVYFLVGMIYAERHQEEPIFRVDVERFRDWARRE